jgi:hypothetical protein
MVSIPVCALFMLLVWSLHLLMVASYAHRAALSPLWLRRTRNADMNTMQQAKMRKDHKSVCNRSGTQHQRNKQCQCIAFLTQCNLHPALDQCAYRELVLCLGRRSIIMCLTIVAARSCCLIATRIQHVVTRLQVPHTANVFLFLILR